MMKLSKLKAKEPKTAANKSSPTPPQVSFQFRKGEGPITIRNIAPILPFMSLKDLFQLIKVNSQFSKATAADPLYQSFLLLKNEFYVRKKEIIPNYQKLLLTKKNILDISKEIDFDRFSLETLLKKDAQFIKKLILRNNVPPPQGELFFSEILRRVIAKRAAIDGVFSLSNCELRNNCNYLNRALKDFSELSKIELSFNNQLSLQSIPNVINSTKRYLQVLNLSHNGLNDLSSKFLFTSLKTNCPHLKLLDISFNNLTDSSMKSASEYFSSLTQIQKLNLSHNVIGSKGASTLFLSLSSNTSIVLLNISFNGIDNTLFETYNASVEDFFSKNKKLLCLYYCGNYLPPGAMDKFAKSLIQNTKIAYLYLDNNQINDEALEYLSFLVSHNPKLIGLSLSYNRFTDIGIGKLFEQIAWRTMLVELNLSQNNLSEKAIKVIVDTLCKNRRIGSLNLSSNTLKDGDAIAQLIRMNTSLKNLNLSNCHLGLQCKKICEALEVNKKLAVIDLSVNEIGKNRAILDLVSKMLKENFFLRFVYLNENYLTDDDLISLCEGLKNNKNVNSLIMKRNKIELRKSMPNVYKSLRKNDHIKVIDLEGNPISSAENLAELNKVLQLNGTRINIEAEP